MPAAGAVAPAAGRSKTKPLRTATIPRPARSDPPEPHYRRRETNSPIGPFVAHIACRRWPAFAPPQRPGIAPPFTQPRELNQQQQSALTTLAAQVMSQLELRRIITERDEALAARRKAEERQTLLIRELHHRVRNALATVQALLGATARSSSSVERFYHSFSGRIASLARTQTLLTDDYWQMAPFRDMLEQALRPFLE